MVRQTETARKVLSRGRGVVAGQTIAETGIQDSGRLRGRGYWDKTETEADVDTGTSTDTMKERELRLWLERLGVHNSTI